MGIWSWLADKLHFILSYEAGFYKPTVLKFHPPFLQDYSTCQVGWNVSLSLLAPRFRSKSMLHEKWGLNPQPLSHESSALTTRPWLLARFVYNFILFTMFYSSDHYLRAHKFLSLFVLLH